MNIIITQAEYGDLILPALFFYRAPTLGSFREALQLLEKLEDIGAPTGPKGEEGFIPLRIAGETQSLEFTPNEASILKNALEALVGSLPVGVGRRIPSLIDRLT